MINSDEIADISQFHLINVYVKIIDTFFSILSIRTRKAIVGNEDASKSREKRNASKG